MGVLYIVVPCYNEEEVLRDTAGKLLSKINGLIKNGTIDDKSKILFINDGSKDNTWNIIETLCSESDAIRGISLAHNKGHQNALLAGLMVAKEHADMVISMDADLQDDIDAIDEMLEKYESECDIVYGVRKKRDKDTVFKRITAESFYKIMRLLGADTVYNHADYRLMSKVALEALAEYKEVNLFLRGIIPMLGFKTDCVYYDRGERLAGESKYPLKKMIAFAWEGITSLSIVPIRIITATGFVVSIIGIVMMIYSLIRHLTGATVVGWSSLIMTVWLIGGVTIISIGIIGEYIGKIYLETKARPRYIIEKQTFDRSES
ncbi:MAG: glycosyltransferase family 2 protein [Oscillospiraceae bacterium]|nr:glycosyltransferase family 2 protein [Oscillospiraceae bacterium]